MSETWQSPRKIQLDVIAYQRKRFEDYMTMADNGVVERAIAISALREEILYEQTGVQHGIEVTEQNHQVA